MTCFVRINKLFCTSSTILLGRIRKSNCQLQNLALTQLASRLTLPYYNTYIWTSTSTDHIYEISIFCEEKYKFCKSNYKFTENKTLWLSIKINYQSFWVFDKPANIQILAFISSVIFLNVLKRILLCSNIFLINIKLFN